MAHFFNDTILSSELEDEIRSTLGNLNLNGITYDGLPETERAARLASAIVSRMELHHNPQNGDVNALLNPLQALMTN